MPGRASDFSSELVPKSGVENTDGKLNLPFQKLM
jgi:hypothetical protein